MPYKNSCGSLITDAIDLVHTSKYFHYYSESESENFLILKLFKNKIFVLLSLLLLADIHYKYGCSSLNTNATELVYT